MAIIVKKEPGESEDRLISKFRKKVQLEQILTLIKERQHYKKPSVLKKERLSRFRKKGRKKPKKRIGNY
ncbi:MAG TPA: 30S ribosomal protein S21 [Candidatus Bathyarchaeia archaeon]|nr:30S ribosomal protein S21 [Candidatus Bathyarchaeia archaeon]